MLSSSNIDRAWAAYEAAERDRVRDVYLAKLGELIQVLQSLPEVERFAWARGVARQSVDEEAATPVRMPLFREVLFPALHAGLQAREPGCARWLAGFAQLLYKSAECQSQLAAEHRSEIGLLREALVVDPRDELARARFITKMEGGLEYAIHELPAGVLYGHDGATLEQCAELRADLDEFESLVTAHGNRAKHEALITECRYHFTAYPDYLARRPEFRSYADYLTKMNPE